MTNEEYMRHQNFLAFAATMATSQSLDLPGFLNAINRAESVGSILDPGLWLKGNAKLAEVKKLAQAFKVFHDEVKRQQHG